MRMPILSNQSMAPLVMNRIVQCVRVCQENFSGSVKKISLAINILSLCRMLNISHNANTDKQICPVLTASRTQSLPKPDASLSANTTSRQLCWSRNGRLSISGARLIALLFRKGPNRQFPPKNHQVEPVLSRLFPCRYQLQLFNWARAMNKFSR